MIKVLLGNLVSLVLNHRPEVVKSRESLRELLLTSLGGEAKKILDEEQVRCTCIGREGRTCDP